MSSLEWRDKNRQRLNQYAKDYYRKNKARIAERDRMQRESRRALNQWNHEHGVHTTLRDWKRHGT